MTTDQSASGQVRRGPSPSGPGPSGLGPSGPGPSGPTVFEQVREFSRAFGLPTRDAPAGTGLGAPPTAVALRRRLLEEEVGELADAVAAEDLTAVADAIADIVYVALGTADLLGIPFDAVFAEVHRANMAKLGADGRPVLRDDGKVLKGPQYTPPDVAGVLDRARTRWTPRR